MIADLYLRLSLEDDDLKDESNSITSQRQILKDYLDSREEFSGYMVREHVDDGYTGTNMNRPAFQKMMELVKKNQVQLILVKDLSRFARDYIEAGTYIDQIFPFMQVRFISVGDGYDSNKNEHGISSIDVPFKNLVYDYYSKDISQKMKASVKVRQERGDFFGSKAPYGYTKSKEDHHQLIVDETVRGFVEEIYERYLNGESMSSIAHDFNKRNILTPGKYIGLKRGTGIWTGQIVRYVLTNPIYTGTITGGKTRVQEVGSGIKKWVNSDERIVVENKHEAIISKEDFGKVQEKLNANPKNITRERKHVHILQDKIYCGHCHHKMSFTVYHGKKSGYYCSYRYKIKDCSCMKGKIAAEILEDVVSREIQFHTEDFLAGEKTRAIEHRVKQKIRENLMDLKSTLEHEQIKMQNLKIQFYERFKSSIIGKEEYLAEKEQQLQRELEIAEELSIVEAKIKENMDIEHNLNIDVLREFVSGGTLVKEWLEEVVDRIYVYDKDKVEIVWRFQ